MNKIKNRKQLQLLLRGPYEWVKRNNPILLDKQLPSRRTKEQPLEKLSELSHFCKTYNKFPVIRGNLPDENRLNSMAGYLKKQGYKEEINNLMKLYGSKAKQLNKIKIFNNSLPNYIKMTGSPTSMNDFVVFLDKDYGKYTAKLCNLDKTIKNKGTIGHPDRDKVTRHTRKSIRRETGEIFISIAEAIRKTGVTGICHALKNPNKTAGGYHWAYCDKDGNIIKG